MKKKHVKLESENVQVRERQDVRDVIKKELYPRFKL
jgi:hypothetical protein